MNDYIEKIVFGVNKKECHEDTPLIQLIQFFNKNEHVFIADEVSVLIIHATSTVFVCIGCGFDAVIHILNHVGIGLLVIREGTCVKVVSAPVRVVSAAVPALNLDIYGLLSISKFHFFILLRCCPSLVYMTILSCIVWYVKKKSKVLKKIILTERGQFAGSFYGLDIGDFY